MNKKRKELVISVIGVLLLILSAAFCYQTVWIKLVNCKTGKQIPARRQEKIQDTLLQDQ